MSEQDKVAFAAKKGVNYHGRATKGGGKDQGRQMEPALVARAGTAERVSEISGAKVGSQVGTGLMERASGRRA